MILKKPLKTSSGFLLNECREREHNQLPRCEPVLACLLTNPPEALPDF